MHSILSVDVAGAGVAVHCCFLRPQLRSRAAWPCPSKALLSGHEGSEFATTGDVAENLLIITVVHPMRKEAVRELLRKAGAH